MQQANFTSVLIYKATVARFQFKAMHDPEAKVPIKSGHELDVQKLWEKIRTKNKTDIGIGK